MPLVLEVLLDEHSTRQVRRLWQRIQQAGFPSPLGVEEYVPHLTLAVSDAQHVPLAPLTAALTSHAAALPVPQLTLSFLGRFTIPEHVVFLGVTPSHALLQFHQQLFTTFCQWVPLVRDLYTPGRWVPHITLAYDLTPEQAAGILALDWDRVLPLQAYGITLALLHVEPERAEVLFTAPIGTAAGGTTASQAGQALA